MLLYTDLCYLYIYILYYYYIVNIISIILQELQYSKDKGRVPLRTQNKEEGRGSSMSITLIWYVTFIFLDSLFYVYFIRGSAQPNCLAGQPVFGRASGTTQCIHWEFLDVTIAIYYDCLYK